eukprot:6202374-Pleurochrysis_carterae.AAC.1
MVTYRHTRRGQSHEIVKKASDRLKQSLRKNAKHDGVKREGVFGSIEVVGDAWDRKRTENDGDHTEEEHEPTARARGGN